MDSLKVFCLHTLKSAYEGHCPLAVQNSLDCCTLVRLIVRVIEGIQCNLLQGTAPGRGSRGSVLCLGCGSCQGSLSLGEEWLVCQILFLGRLHSNILLPVYPIKLPKLELKHSSPGNTGTLAYP